MDNTAMCDGHTRSLSGVKVKSRWSIADDMKKNNLSFLKASTLRLPTWSTSLTKNAVTPRTYLTWCLIACS